MAPWVIDISFLYISIKLYINLLKHVKVCVQEYCEFSYRSKKGLIATLFIHIEVIWFWTRVCAAVLWTTGDNT